MQALFDLQLSSIKALHPTQASVDQQPRLHILAGKGRGPALSAHLFVMLATLCMVCASMGQLRRILADKGWQCAHLGSPVDVVASMRALPRGQAARPSSPACSAALFCRRLCAAKLRALPAESEGSLGLLSEAED